MRLVHASATVTALITGILLSFSFGDDLPPNHDAAIEQIIRSGTAAFNAGDFKASVKDLHATRYTSYGSSPQGELADVPREALVELMQAFIPASGGVRVSDPIDLNVWAHGEAAFATYLRKVETGAKKWSTLRMTAVFYKIDGVWQLVHEHQSVLM